MTGISSQWLLSGMAWQCLSKRTIGLSLRIKLHASTTDFNYQNLGEKIWEKKDEFSILSLSKNWLVNILRKFVEVRALRP
jgi:hypothetical protein